MKTVQYHDWPGRRTSKALFASIAGSLWLVALVLPAYDNDTFGIEAFAFGWMLLFDGETLGFLGWFSNIPFITAMLMFIIGRRPGVIRASMILSIVAMVFSLGALNIDQIPQYQGTDYVKPYFGCYVWLIGIMTLMIGTIVYTTTLEREIKTSRQSQK